MSQLPTYEQAPGSPATPMSSVTPIMGKFSPSCTVLPATISPPCSCCSCSFCLSAAPAQHYRNKRTGTARLTLRRARDGLTLCSAQILRINLFRVCRSIDNSRVASNTSPSCSSQVLNTPVTPFLK